MKPVLMITIVNRSAAEEFVTFFKKEGLPRIISALGLGTASDEILSYLGLGEPEKQVFFTVIPGTKSKKVMQDFIYQMQFETPGSGIAFTIPISSIDRISAVDCVEPGDVKKEEQKMEQAEQQLGHEVIIVITNRGYVEEVMDAARAEGARGGTTIHARATGLEEEVKKFFGVSISDEKEMVFIVVGSAIKQSVMKSIMAKAGMHTKAKSLLFSLPVSGVAGLRPPKSDISENEEN